MLFLVATPIGNLNDITYRAKEVLQDVDYIYAEDTRVFKKLANLLELKTTNKIRSFNLINENTKDIEIIDLLKKNMKVALVSDAGYPLISDPGYTLVKKANEEEIEVIPIPGASALTLALIKSGFKTDEYTFFGFLRTKKNKNLKDIVNEIKSNKRTSIFYISKHDLDNVDVFLTKEFENHNCAVVKELTKKNEKIYIEEGHQVIKIIKKEERRGEFVLLIEGKEEKEDKTDLLNDLIKISSPSIKKREKARIISKITKSDSKDIYKKLTSN